MCTHAVHEIDRLKIGIARYPYSGNGGTMSEIPQIGSWLAKTLAAIKADPRCDPEVWSFMRSDTPIPMVRNLSCKLALDAGVDVLVMIDSDNAPDIYLGKDDYALPFWDSSFDFLYHRRKAGQSPCVIVAPYCGPDPGPFGGESNVYVFRWHSTTNDPHQRQFNLQSFGREEAAMRIGMCEVAAGPTGLCMIDLRALQYKGSGGGTDWTPLPPPWFYYDWKDPLQTEKASTEDVVFTRNCSLLNIPVFCNWNAWAGHYKPVMVGKPGVLTCDEIRQTYRDAILAGIESDDRIMEVNPGVDLEEVCVSTDGEEGHV